MKVDSYRVESRLTVVNLAEVFRSTAEGLYSGKAKAGAGFRRLIGQLPAGQRLEFFTPKDDSPFAVLDRDRAHFAVAASIPKFAGSGGGNVVLHCYIWDRHVHRSISLLSPHTIGSSSSSKSALAKVVEAIRTADPGARVTQG